ncbi:GspE/PulE family protein [Clostridium fallax]|uniref:Type IV pilus assembly protein PilB n=1 Tax=Clostridium fallax TaxID=1533 RepID=A0A1M4YIA9_9CLOT|nr:GspE/PulE family protein [Clostridium fallax]SHF05383.1 type IV pilus assembly protein PilB [Clostridium fallax]SQB06321.1 general secretion pathway protein [Clostridium fallax]
MEFKNIKAEWVYSISKEYAYKNLLIPININEEYVEIAIVSDFRENIINSLKLQFNKTIKVTIKKEEDILKALNYFYLTKKNDDNIINNILVNEIIKNAIKIKASDIHIEPKEKEIIIKNRVNGVLSIFKKIKKEYYDGIISKIKLLASMNISEKRKPQDGKITYKYQDENYDLRVSSILTITGEKIVIRILYKSLFNYSLEELNFNKDSLIKIKKLINKENGIVLISGPTGSGKTTTLYSMLKAENKGNLNITTIEDPVEMNFESFNQINVNESVGLTFSKGLKHILRQDPNVIMIGEIRDEETARIALRAAITGHKVYSTIHTNNHYEVFSRLKEMGIEKYLLLNAIKGIITQRLIGRLCDSCKIKYESTKEERAVLGNDSITYLYKQGKCEKCNFTGIISRKLLSHIYLINRVEQNHIREYLNEEILKNQSNEFISRGKYLCIEGKISFNQFLAIKEGMENE